MFLVTTGERAAPYTAVFGYGPMTLEEFNQWEYMQQRALQMNTEEGRKALEMDVNVGLAEELDEVEHERHDVIAQEQADALRRLLEAEEVANQEFMRIQQLRLTRGLDS